MAVLCQVVNGSDLLMAASDGGLSDGAENRIGPGQSPNSVIRKSYVHLKGLLLSEKSDVQLPNSVIRNRLTLYHKQ